MYQQKGLSLVELMVAVTLGLVLMGGVIQLFLSSRVVFSTQQSLSRVQENGRFAIEFITRDLRQAGYAGCTNRNLPVTSDLAVAGVSFWDAYTLPSEDMLSVQGFVNQIGGVALAPAPLPGDILVVRYADIGAALQIQLHSLRQYLRTHQLEFTSGRFCGEKRCAISLP